jgi:hypothetical protein
MSNKNKLIAYELKNLAFFVILILVLGIFISWVMQNYKIRGKDWARESEGEKGILSEAVSPVGDTCIFYVGTNLSETTRKYLNQMDTPVTDDGFIAGFFEIPGLTSVIVNKKTVMLQKSPSASWGTIQPLARELIKKHLHPH